MEPTDLKPQRPSPWRNRPSPSNTNPGLQFVPKSEEKPHETRTFEPLEPVTLESHQRKALRVLIDAALDTATTLNYLRPFPRPKRVDTIHAAIEELEQLAG